ncbi:MAG TPA: type VI secretion system tube protein Hcp [Thermoanaerobaculia bacterium]|nr:type VI secretion system tube protein Hcp [Thermoanaerobaculia bacterium]
MAINAYLKLDGIEGECTAAGHEKEIEIMSWNHGFTQPTSTTRSSQGSAVEQAQHSNFTFTKYIDKATAPILKRCWTGEQIKSAIVTCYRADGSAENKPVEYLKVEMTGVIISNYSVSGGAGDVPVENVSLDYGIVKYTYKPQKEADGKPGDQIPIQHDLTTRKVS